MLTHDMIGTDEDLARETLIIGRSIAPCIDSFPDGSERQKDAIAVLSRVYTACIRRGPRNVKSQRIGPADVAYFDVGSAFDGDSRRALAALCTAASGASAAGAAVGSFPLERPLRRVWPETYS